jgi:hypothetical protein
MKTDCFVGDNIHYAYLPALVSTNMFATGDEIKLHSTYIYIYIYIYISPTCFINCVERRLP